MKPLLTLLKIVIIGILWSIFFIEGIRVILLTNWHFDIFRTSHWFHAWRLWMSGWVIDEPKEWAFVLIIFTAVPVWITGWAALSTINFSSVFGFLGVIPLNFFKKTFGKQVQKITGKTSVNVVQKKKSYKEIRPRNIRAPLDDNLPKLSPLDEERKASLSGIPFKPKPRPSAAAPLPIQPQAPKEFTHNLFEMGDAEPIDFDLFADPEPPAAPQPKPEAKTSNPHNNNNNSKKKAPEYTSAPKQKTSSVNSSFELLKQKGYEIITGATIKNTFIDFIGISKSSICLCINDKEPGDWLADEERFNDEEPLWFSESSHRISPVRKVDLARRTLEEKLNEAELSFEVIPFVIEQIGNIINAEDMLDIWKDMKVNVTRIDRGTPKEIPLLAKTLEDADGLPDKDILDKLKKMLRNIAK